MIPNNKAKPRSAKSSLTQRQSQILEHLIAGHTDRGIGIALRIHEETVGHHLRVMFRRYNVHCRTALVAKLIAENGGDPPTRTCG